MAALTGAGGFLVSEMARGLANAGVRVALMDAKLEHAEPVAGDIRTAGCQDLAREWGALGFPDGTLPVDERAAQ